MTRRDTTNSLLAAALSYAQRGWPVLPLRAGDKVPDGRLVRHGLNDASTDERRLRAWWAAAPSANVGIRTGCGLEVVDLDSAGARARLAATSPDPDEIRSLGASIVVRTGRGWHLWFASSGLATRAGVLEGVDVRGIGGYVVAPPSRHPSGERYQFVDPTTGEMSGHLSKVALTAVPTWLVALLTPDTSHASRSTPVRLDAGIYVRVAVDAESAAVATTPEGSRNDRLNRAAFSLGTLVGAQLLDSEQAEATLLEAAQRAGLGGQEVRRTIASGLSAGARRPRQIAVRGPSGREPLEAQRSHVPPDRRAALPSKAAPAKSPKARER